jgi:CRP-like cAMP-binding protein
MAIDPRKFHFFRHATKTRVFPAGSVIFTQGDDGHQMYAIKRGRVEIIVNGQVADTLGEEEIFGEMALLEHKPRSATVKAVEETELVELNETEFYVFVRQFPNFALQVTQLVLERHRHNDALYGRAAPVAQSAAAPAFRSRS